jgi:rhodanese-related sulfurtransferase
LLCRFSADPRSCSRKARDKFDHYGIGVLCVSKFVPGLDGLMPPLAGAEGVWLPRFLVFDLIGSFLWAACYVGLGYVFFNQLEIAISWTTHFATALTVGLATPLVLYAAWRGFVLVRMIRQLKLRRISPRMLARKLKSKKKVAVLDLLNFEEESGSQVIEAIPGSFSIDPARLRKSPQLLTPNDVQIVLYCSSRRDVVSARVALALRGIGIDKVWVLDGGLKAWREEGFPVSDTLLGPEVVAHRFGIKLPEPPLPIEGNSHENDKFSRNENNETQTGYERLFADF